MEWAACSKPLIYPSEKAFKDRSCYKGKQIITNPQKEGKGIEVYFEKKHPWLFDVRAPTARPPGWSPLGVCEEATTSRPTPTDAWEGREQRANAGAQQQREPTH